MEPFTTANQITSLAAFSPSELETLFITLEVKIFGDLSWAPEFHRALVRKTVIWGVVHMAIRLGQEREAEEARLRTEIESRFREELAAAIADRDQARAKEDRRKRRPDALTQAILVHVHELVTADRHLNQKSNWKRITDNVVQHFGKKPYDPAGLKSMYYRFAKSIGDKERGSG